MTRRALRLNSTRRPLLMIGLLACMGLLSACEEEEQPKNNAANNAANNVTADMSGRDMSGQDMGGRDMNQPSPDMAGVDMASPGPDMGGDPVGPFGNACFPRAGSRVAGIYQKTMAGGAGDLVRACAPEWGCSADLTDCASADSNPGATKICRDDVISMGGASRTYGRFVWKSDLAGSNQMWPILQECPENTPVCSPDGSLSCATSVKDVTSPWAKFACPTKPELENPTGLPIDCRCAINNVSGAGQPQCQRVTVVSDRGERFGQGPDFGRNTRLLGGFVEAASRELIIAARWQDSSGKYGMIWAVNMDSGDRRVISGAFLDNNAGFTRVVKGDGAPSFVEPYHVLKGPDGDYYVADRVLNPNNPSQTVAGRVRVLRVSPATGDRTLVWDSGDRDAFGWCPHRSTVSGTQATPWEDINIPTFAMDAQGRFYFANSQGGRGSGTAILRISADGSTCEDITRSGATAANGYTTGNLLKGGGFDVSQGTYEAISVDGDTLYAVNLPGRTLVEIDIPTGDRKLLSSAGNALLVGSGPTGRDGIPSYYTIKDPSDDGFIWVVGDEGKTLMVRVDKRTGNRAPISPELNNPKWERFVFGPMFTGNLAQGGMWFDPADPNILYFAHDGRGVVKAELDFKNNYILSL